jgi:AbrB family looped-hinge helix DNA binding protein
MAVIVAAGRLLQKNQLTLPKAIVEGLGIEPGDTLIFQIDDDTPRRVHIRPLLRSYAGILTGVYGETPEEVAAYLREERESWGE